MIGTMRTDSSNLDILRSLAVLFVVVSHLPIAWLSTLTSYHFQALGLLGVLIFFVHTCLVLMISLDRQTTREGVHNRALSFLIRRIFRIYPLSIATIVLVSSFEYYTSGQFNIHVIVSNILLIQNITDTPSNPGALWSLPYEVQMYLLLPALYSIINISKNTAPIYIGMLWAVATGIVLALWKLGMNYHLVKYIPCFIPGVLAFSLRTSEKNFRAEWLFFYIAMLAILFPIAVAMGARENILAWPICLALGLLIPKCAETNSVWLEKVAKLLARYSFGIYLAHGPCIDFAFQYYKAAPETAQLLIFICSTAIASYIAYHAIENPCIEFGRRLAHRLSNSPTLRQAPEGS